MTLALTDSLLRWYDSARRDLPWRRPGTGPWAVLVSEVMLQQTPVRRVVPVYEAWLSRWSTPASLARASAGDAVRMWGKLGYPRRALRLHACAHELVSRFGGRVPADVEALLSLPGIGAYTARAVSAFGHGRRVPVVDTNVRRVVARLVRGEPRAPATTARDLAAVEALLPPDPDAAVRVSVALMELGALVCTEQAPRCGACPLAGRCEWRLAGAPDDGPARRRPQRYVGTDRQVRGLLLDVLRGSPGPVRAAALDATWPEPVQRGRALDGLVADGLVEPLADGRFALPGHG
jgi:A/G-specific adenine glycosylase